jgi:pyruvate,water dikinase
MTGWFGKLLEQWRQRRRERHALTISELTARYHIFRTLLDSNNQAVELLTELDWRLRATAQAAEQRQPVARLVELTREMVEKLNLLDDDRHRTLFGLHHRLASRIRELLAQLPALPVLPSCLPLEAVRPEMRSAVGGKAANLARFRQAHQFPVPDGFVVTAQACRGFLEYDGLFLRLGGMLQRGGSAEQRFPAHTVTAVQEAIRRAPLPRELAECLARAARPFWENGRGLAVRSSALAEDGRRHSFAGQFVTVLNVVDQPALEDGFRQVVASGYNRRSLAYRLQAGLDPLDFDMAVLCLEMVPARAAGILLTESPWPDHDGPLVSGVFGLGEAAVSGSSPADLYLLDRHGGLDRARSTIADKEEQLVCLPEGGIGPRPVPAAERRQPVLSEAQLATLADWGRTLAAAEGSPQDLEWATLADGELVLLQARPQVLGQATTSNTAAAEPSLFRGGISAAGGSATGRVHLVKRRQDLTELAEPPLILVMHQSLVDAVGAIDKVAGLLIDLGNPADHLALVARESGIPMLCGLGDATSRLAEEQWLTVDGGRGTVHPASPADIAAAREAAKAVRAPAAPPPADPLTGELRELIIPLNLTDAFGPTFVISECRSLHDMIRYIHEKAVLAMFNAGDAALEEGGVPVRILDSEVPFIVNLIDLGGGLAPDPRPRRLVKPEAIMSVPFRALWQGIANPDLHWGPAGSGAMGSVMSNFLTDHRSARPVGLPNYAIISRDYLNLNARMDFHFTMIDAVCGLTPRSNYARFRFKGGGTGPAQRQRRALCIARILEEHGFYTDVRDDLVNGSLQGVPTPLLTEKIQVLGQLLGFTRLLDAVMRDDRMIDKVAQAFLQGDFMLRKLTEELAGKGGGTP